MADTAKRDLQRGFGSDERPVIGVLWNRDSQGQNAAMQSRGEYQPNNRHVDYRRYYDRDYFQQELEKVWTKQWLFACLEEDVPEVGDRTPLHVGPLSYFIVRTGPDEFKAFYNSCLHRGTRLCNKTESGSSIRCPYHAWEWHNDGRLKTIPSHWDFPDITRANGSLPEVKLGRWGGFIFINADPDAAPLEEALGVIPAHFKDFKPETRYTKSRFRKLVHANWKAAQEAFQESYHLYSTHPEGVPFNGDSQSQYDIFKTPMGAVGREAVPSGVPSMHADPSATAAAAAMAFAEVAKVWHYPNAEPPVIDPAKDVRAQLGQWARNAYKQAYGRDNTQPDGVLLDSTLYFMYPHFCIWLSEAVPFVYQFLPHESDPEKSYFDVRLMVPFAEGQERPPAAPLIEIGEDESVFAKAPLFSFLGMIFDQDMANMPLVQQGLRAADPQKPFMRLGQYQEAIIQHWHELFDRDMKR